MVVGHQRLTGGDGVSRLAQHIVNALNQFDDLYCVGVVKGSQQGNLSCAQGI